MKNLIFYNAVDCVKYVIYSRRKQVKLGKKENLDIRILKGEKEILVKVKIKNINSFRKWLVKNGKSKRNRTKFY